MSNSIEAYSEFRRKVLLGVRERIGDNTSADIKEVVKNNGVVLYGLTISKEIYKICPTIYLENYYEMYEQGETLSKIISDIIEMHEMHREPEFENMDFFGSYEMVKRKLGIKIINQEYNEKLLEDIPHRNFQNLAIVAYVEVDNAKEHIGTVLIHNNHICMWGVREKELIDDAINNAIINNPPQFDKMSEVIKMMMEDTTCELSEGHKVCSEDYEEAMYVLSNSKQLFGASVIAYPGLLQKISRCIKDNFYIIPSSIHEVIIIPQRMCESIDLNSMIRSVNSEMLTREEILGEQAYLYIAKTNQLSIISDTE